MATPTEAPATGTGIVAACVISTTTTICIGGEIGTLTRACEDGTTLECSIECPFDGDKDTYMPPEEDCKTTEGGANGTPGAGGVTLDLSGAITSDYRTADILSMYTLKIFELRMVVSFFLLWAYGL